MITLAWLSLLPPNAAPVLGSKAPLTFDVYRSLFTTPRNLTIVFNTLIMLAATATITMIIAFLVSWAIVRGRWQGRSFLDGVSFLPYAFPGVTIAIALIFVFLNPPGQHDPDLRIPVDPRDRLTVGYIAFSTRLMNGAISQIGRDLEDVGRTSGATQLIVMYRITLPLLMPAFISGWIWVASHAMRSFSVPLVLSSQRNMVIAPEIWRVWQRGYLAEAAAYGIVLTVILIPLTIWMRRLMGEHEGVPMTDAIAPTGWKRGAADAEGQGPAKGLSLGGEGGQRHRRRVLLDRGRRVLHAAGAVGLRQEHDAALRGRPRARQQRHHRDRRPAGGVGGPPRGAE